MTQPLLSALSFAVALAATPSCFQLVGVVTMISGITKSKANLLSSILAGAVEELRLDTATLRRMSLVSVSSSRSLPTPSCFRSLLSSSSSLAVVPISSSTPLMKSQQLFSAPSCFQLLGVIHFHSRKRISHLEFRHLLAQKCISGFHNCKNSTSSPRIKLQRLLVEKSKSGFDHLDDALFLFRKMLHMRPLPNVIDFTQMLTALVKMQQYSLVISLFVQMCSLRIPVDIITFSIAINCYCHCDRVDYAFSLLAGIFKRGFVLDVITYTTLIRGLLSQHKSAEAELLFTNLIRFEQAQPNVVTFTTMIDGLCKTGHTDKALWWFEFMEKCDCKPDIVTYTMLIDYLCKCALVDDALNLYSKMIENGIFPDTYTFTVLVDAYSRTEKLDDAKRIIEIMIETGASPDIVTYNTLLRAYCSLGDSDGALDVLNTIASKKIVPTSYTYNTLLDAYCKNMNIDTAMELYGNMACEGLRPTVVTHNILLHGLCQLGKVMEALTFFYKIQDQGHETNIVTYRILLTGLFRSHDVDKALTFFHALKCSGLVPETATYNVVIRGCLRNKEYIEARKLVDEMFDCGFLAESQTISLLQRLLSSQEQDPTLRAMYQKCLHSEMTIYTKTRIGAS